MHVQSDTEKLHRGDRYTDTQLPPVTPPQLEKALVESERSQLAKLEQIAQNVNAEYARRRNVTEASFEVKDGFGKHAS